MKLDITKGMRTYLQLILENGPQDFRGLVRLTNRDYEAVRSTMLLIQRACGGTLLRVSKAAGDSGGRPVHVFDVSEELRAMSLEAAKKLLADSVRAGALYRANKHKPTRRAKEIAKDQEKIEFIRVNAQFTCVTTISKMLGESEHNVQTAARLAGIEVGDEVKDPRAHDIEATNEYLPIGTTVEHWLRGTSIHLPSETPGITRVTRHYAAD